MASLEDFSDMIIQTQLCLIEYDADVTGWSWRWNTWITDSNGHFIHTTRGHNDDEISLAIIHHKFVQDHPYTYFFDASLNPG